jgi:creatinine amidohydrolase
MTAAARTIPEHLAGNRHVRFGGSTAFGWLSDDFGPSGVIGDPTGASAELGKAQFEAMVAAMGEAFEEISRFRHLGPA